MIQKDSNAGQLWLTVAPFPLPDPFGQPRLFARESIAIVASQDGGLMVGEGNQLGMV